MQFPFQINNGILRLTNNSTKLKFQLGDTLYQSLFQIFATTVIRAEDQHSDLSEKSKKIRLWTICMMKHPVLLTLYVIILCLWWRKGKKKKEKVELKITLLGCDAV